MYLEELEIKIKNNNIEDAIDLIEEIGNNKNIEAVRPLIHHLLTTDNKNLRNAIAIALSDIGNSEAIEPLIYMLKSPNTVGSKGTLLYALENFNCGPFAELIVDLLFDDSFEVSRQSFLLLESNAKTIPTDLKHKCIKKIMSKIDNLRDQTEFLRESIEILRREL
ncbi:HEAT repeat domain-containing protein [Cytobacillus massiliigabonensis]|uniref:HEAT repeat domain-containing protein n=1 Tax=Cytobacillus massiliigabonensis TaxID=1871011 RepID=UPI000C84844E|nr:HEAT repeat domain-containing protein [Cytobacillus massiliigabonensis]